jgi:glycosyltransferase involved in cell wall biosynthesis
MTSISVLILTKNEELDLPACLKSVAWSNDIHVLDSMSTDHTVEIATAAGAKVTQRVFDGYARQRNAGLSLPFKNPWLLILDADERATPELREEIERFIVQPPNDTSAASIRRRDIWWGQWLKHAQISPFYVRLVRVGHAHYEREINEVLVVNGETATLSTSFDHHPFSKGLDHWIAKHNVYSRMEAQLIATGSVIKPSWRRALTSKDFHERRSHQKAIFYGLPGRPLVKFLFMLIARRAFLDGWPGIRYALLQSIYEYFIVLKTKELREEKSEQ